MGFHPLGEAHHTCRVFLKDNTVFKFFREPRDCKFELLQQVAVLENLQLQYMMSDKTTAILSYTYISGSHQPRVVREFAPVVCILERIHDLGFVHGDIRVINLIFVPDGNIVLIDYDLAEQEGTASFWYVQP